MEKDDLVKDIHGHVIELVKQGAVHNELLRTHEARSLELQKRQESLDNKVENRLAPLEKHMSWILVVLSGLGTVLVGLILKALSQALF